MTDAIHELAAALANLAQRVRQLEAVDLPTIGGGGAGAPNTALYVTLALSAGLTNERVLTEGPDIDLVDGGANTTITVGRGGDTILLFDSGGNPIAEFAATSAGFDLASAAATAGDTIWLPSLTISGNHTLTASVHYVGESRYGSILSGQITGASGATLENLSIVRSANDAGALYGIVGQAAGTFKLNACDISVTQAGAGEAYGIYHDAAGTIEAWQCAIRSPAGGAGNHYGTFRNGGGPIYLEGGVCIGATAACNE